MLPFSSSNSIPYILHSEEELLKSLWACICHPLLWYLHSLPVRWGKITVRWGKITRLLPFNWNLRQNNTDCVTVWLIIGWHDLLKTIGFYSPYSRVWENQAASADTAGSERPIFGHCERLFLTWKGLRLWQVCKVVYSRQELEGWQVWAREGRSIISLSRKYDFGRIFHWG